MWKKIHNEANFLRNLTNRSQCECIPNSNFLLFLTFKKFFYVSTFLRFNKIQISTLILSSSLYYGKIQNKLVVLNCYKITSTKCEWDEWDWSIFFTLMCFQAINFKFSYYQMKRVYKIFKLNKSIHLTN